MVENTLLKNISKYIDLTQDEISTFERFWTEKHWKRGTIFCIMAIPVVMIVMSFRVH